MSPTVVQTALVQFSCVSIHFGGCSYYQNLSTQSIATRIATYALHECIPGLCNDLCAISRLCIVIAKSWDCLHNLEIAVQYKDSKNALCNSRFGRIPRLRRTYTQHLTWNYIIKLLMDALTCLQQLCTVYWLGRAWASPTVVSIMVISCKRAVGTCTQDITHITLFKSHDRLLRFSLLHCFQMSNETTWAEGFPLLSFAWNSTLPLFSNSP